MADLVWTLPAQPNQTARWEEPTGGGGAAAGAARVLGPFPFAFDDAGLNDGIAFYTPTVGDVIIDVLVTVSESFDGTTPTADVGTFVGSAFGVFGSNAYGVGPDLNTPENYANWGTGVKSQTGNGSPRSLSLAQTQSASPGATAVTVPAVVFVANPIKIVVSQDGTAGGDPVGGTSGAGAVYIVVATPSLT